MGLSHEQQAVQQITQLLHARYEADSLASDNTDEERSVEEDEIPEPVVNGAFFVINGLKPQPHYLLIFL